jgi:hypothetical protein
MGFNSAFKGLNHKANRKQIMQKSRILSTDMEITPARNARHGHMKDSAVSKELRLPVPKAFSQLTRVLHAA